MRAEEYPSLKSEGQVQQRDAELDNGEVEAITLDEFDRLIELEASLHPFARDDVDEGWGWYLERSERAASTFRKAVRSAIHRLTITPKGGRATLSGTS